MKKISVFLLAAMLIGVSSAFTTATPTVGTEAHGYYQGNWYTIDTDDVNITYLCDSGSESCLYTDEVNFIPLPGQPSNEQFVKKP
jgi:hypothetical protein